LGNLPPAVYRERCSQGNILLHNCLLDGEAYEFVKITVPPVHGRLNDLMKACERIVGPNLHAPPNRWANLGQGQAELIELLWARQKGNGFLRSKKAQNQRINVLRSLLMNEMASVRHDLYFETTRKMRRHALDQFGADTTVIASKLSSQEH
jgi:hypothetical protein